jgi:hypothetical protein
MFRIDISKEYTDRADMSFESFETSDESKVQAYLGGLALQANAIMVQDPGKRYTFYIKEDNGVSYKMLNVSIFDLFRS